MENYKASSYDIRKNIVDIIVAGSGGHIGGDTNVTDILLILYFRVMNTSSENRGDENRNMFVMSKGHCVEALYAVLATKGFFPLEGVKGQFSRFGSKPIGHPNNKLPDIEMDSGSLGYGLPVNIGIVLVSRMDSHQNHTYVVIGDGELAEGSVWEGAMATGMHHLDNLCAVVDWDRLQTPDGIEEIMARDSQTERWPSFGQNVIDVADGNGSEQLLTASEEAKTVKGKPTVVIANTVKGCGSAVMEHKAAWHRHVPTAEECAQIIKDFEARKGVVLNE